MAASDEDNNFSGLGMIDDLLNNDLEWMNQTDDGYADVYALFEEEGVDIFSGEFDTMVPSDKGDGLHSGCDKKMYPPSYYNDIMGEYLYFNGILENQIPLPKDKDFSNIKIEAERCWDILHSLSTNVITSKCLWHPIIACDDESSHEALKSTCSRINEIEPQTILDKEFYEELYNFIRKHNY